MLQNEFAHLINGMNAVQVTLALRHSPSEEAMAAEDKSHGAGIVFDRPFNQKCEFETRALPGNPRDLATKFFIELIQLSFSVGARRQGDRPVGMQMVHLGEGKEGVQRSVDR